MVEVIEYPPEGPACWSRWPPFAPTWVTAMADGPTRWSSASAREDALRRDFTINGMFYRPAGTGQVLDYVGGQDDLEAKVFRTIGDPFQRFEEDKLRMMRAVRMASRFELAIDPAAAAGHPRGIAPEINIIGAERIADELRRLLTDQHGPAGCGCSTTWGWRRR